MVNVVRNTTLLIHQESQQYPLTLSSLTYRHPNISFGPVVPISFINELGYSVVTRTVRPNSPVVDELPPVLINGEYIQVFVGREYNDAEILAQLVEKRNRLFESFNSQFDNALNSGIEFTANGQTHFISLHESNRLDILLNLELAKIKINNNDDKPISLTTNDNRYVKMLPIDALALLENAVIKIHDLTQLLLDEKDKILLIDKKEDIDLDLKINF